VTTSTPQNATWSAVLALSLCVFVLIASEFLPVSLLTPLATDLAITEGEAGRAISISGVFAVVTSLLITRVTGGIDRKWVLLCMTGLMLLSAVIVALAPTYAALMIGRALLGVTIGGFYSLSTATVMRLVPVASVPKAIAIVGAGSALAATIAAPVGSFLGGLIGWRGAFACVVPLAAITLCWQALSLPALRSEPMPGTGNVFRLLRRAEVAFGMAAILCLFMGQFALFTYLRPFLEQVTRVEVSTLSLLLLVMGVTGLVGTLLIGSLLQRSFQPVLVIIPLLMSGIAIALIAFGSSLTATALLLGAWGLLGTPAPVGWGTWLSRTLPDDAEAGGGLMVATIQLAITLGASAGGIAFDTSGHEATFALSAIVLVLAGLLAFLAGRGVRVHSDLTAPPIG
jgi:predicted MFS family arabinose efflux permease